jgi:hypothetical protein
MGVKVPQTVRDQPQPVWKAEDDQLLQYCAVRFGMNWMLVARALSGFEDVVINEKTSDATDNRLWPTPRSARQCRDRWQALARSQPALANEVRKSERVLRESALMTLEKIPGSDTEAVRSGAASHLTVVTRSVVLLSNASLFTSKGIHEPANNSSSTQSPMNMDVEGEGGATLGDSEQATISPNTANGTKDVKAGEQSDPVDVKIQVPQPQKPRRSFTALSAAKAKRQFIPITIPGVVSGSQSNQPVPSHPSHMQSVQASLAAQWSSGRTEMWPLQILDCADKQRAASRAKEMTPSSNASSSSSMRRPPTTGGSSSLSHFSPSRDRPSASFPPVPTSTARSNPRSPQISPPLAASLAQAYVPPKNDEKLKPSKGAPSG